MLRPASYDNTAAYLLIMVGIVLSVISAFVPFFEAGYQFLTSVFLAGILPYVVYGLIAPVSRTVSTTVTGMIIVLIHLALVVNKRFIDSADYSDNIIYYIPVFITITILPYVISRCCSIKYPEYKQSIHGH